MSAAAVIRCTVDGEPLVGAYASVQLPMLQKNQYALLFGLSDERGFISLTGDELAHAARAEQAAFPMDYATFPEEWSGGIEAGILDADGVERLREAMSVWGDDHLPPSLAADLDGYEARLRVVSGRRLSAEIAPTN